jgi:hypothetical protein
VTGTGESVRSMIIVHPAPSGWLRPPVPSRVSTRRVGVAGQKLSRGGCSTGVPVTGVQVTLAPRADVGAEETAITSVVPTSAEMATAAPIERIVRPMPEPYTRLPGRGSRPSGYARPMRLLRRILAVLVMTGAAAAAIRVKGKGGTPPQHGGWRPLELPDQRR